MSHSAARSNRPSYRWQLAAGPLAGALAAAGGATGCGPKGAAVGETCDRHDACAPGLLCVEGRCAPPSAAEHAKAGAVGAAEPASCPELAALDGSWRMHTRVLGATNPASLGVVGKYELVVTVQGCAAKAKLLKTGHDRINYSEAKIQRAESTIVPASESPLRNAHRLDFALVDAKGPRAELELHVVPVAEHGLAGVWRYTGASWARRGMWGLVVGSLHDRQAPSTELSGLPCDVQCAIACDAMRRADDGTLEPARLERCREACDADPDAVATCEPLSPLPEALILELQGPYADLEGFCAQWLKQAAPPEDGAPACGVAERIGGRQAAKLGQRALAGGMLEARWLGPGTQGKNPDELRLAIRTAAGWWVSLPVFDLRLEDRGSVQLTGLSMTARELAPAAGREIIAVAAFKRAVAGERAKERSSSSKVIACASAEPRPRCAVVPVSWSDARVVVVPDDDGDDRAGDDGEAFEIQGARHVGWLPGGVLSISTKGDAAVGDRELDGYYRWAAP